MERDKELVKLVNVLRRTARMAMHGEWTGSSEDAAAFCADKYNRVLTRLKELEPAVAAIFEPIKPDSSLTVVAMACRQLAAYFDDEAPGGRESWGGRDWKGIFADPRSGVWADKKAFKEFWAKSAKDIEDFGEFIRERIEEWVHQHKPKDELKDDSPPGDKTN
jgi:hypothetical protein